MQSLVAINRKAQNSKKEHPHGAEEEGVELADHCWRFHLLVWRGRGKLGWNGTFIKDNWKDIFMITFKKDFKNVNI